MDVFKVKLAASNNARLCDAVCCAHGCATDTSATLWLCQGTPPRFYPSAVSLEPGLEQEVRRLRPLAFKDSFNDVELADAGYSIALAGSWIYRESEPVALAGPHWDEMGSDPELMEWESAWRGADGVAKDIPRQFPVSLLRNSNLVFLGCRHDGRIVAGGILCVSDSVVGLSNCFYPASDAQRTMNGLFTESVRRFSGRPVVGWEGGKAFEAAVAAGFYDIGALRVWVTG